ncbi:MAG: hypothetical protein NTZ09_22045, partial [Candidatus Hydrogenedentes bacterium]|nr:hypothetical protein [Candidatus Hydrogenedentota bacterium]
IRLFPNWPLDRPAAFSTLRAVGAFLVTASCANGQVAQVDILSEAGSPLRILNPWRAGARVITASGETRVTDASINVPTTPGQTIRLLPARANK